MSETPDQIDHAFTLAATLRSNVCHNRIEGGTLVTVAEVFQSLAAEYAAFESAANVTRLRETANVDLNAVVQHIETLDAGYHGTPIPGDAYLAIAFDLDDLALACAHTRQNVEPADSAAPAPNSTQAATNHG